MLKVDKKYCRKCSKNTPHSYVGSKAMLEGFGLGRVIAAVGTLGNSEFIGRDRYWQCQKCGDVRKE